jgi:hypothetical protein
METIYSTSQRFQPDFLQVLIVGLFLFAIGFWVGQAKSRKLERKMAKLEKEIRDLNTELLYNTGEPSVVKMHR